MGFSLGYCASASTVNATKYKTLEPMDERTGETHASMDDIGLVSSLAQDMQRPMRKHIPAP